MELSLEQLAARLEACEADLEAHRGYIKALEYGLRAVIASHPNPQVLSLAWGDDARWRCRCPRRRRGVCLQRGYAAGNAQLNP